MPVTGTSFVYFDTLLWIRDGISGGGVPGGVSVIVNDVVDGDVLKQLVAGGTKLVATRSTGFNHIDLGAAKKLGVKVVRVTNYSPNSVAEFAVALLLALNRKIPRAYNRTREGNFELDGLMGFDLVGRTVAVIGTGKIGHDLCPHHGRLWLQSDGDLTGITRRHSEKIGGCYADAEKIQAHADIISLHCPLTPESHHIGQYPHLSPREEKCALDQHEPRRSG